MQDLWADKTPDNTDLVTILWRDIRSVYNWSEDSTVELRPCRAITTVGWLLYEGPDPEEPESIITVIASTYDAEVDAWSDYTFYPNKTVKQKREYGARVQKIHDDTDNCRGSCGSAA